jgi:hypothetical protein
MTSIKTIMTKKIIIFITIILTVFLAVFIFLRDKNVAKNDINSKKKLSFPEARNPQPIVDYGPGFAMLWWTDFNNNRVIGFTPDSKVPWIQNMSADPIPHSSWYFIGGIENVTVAPNGNLITVHGDGMMVQEIDRETHNLVWQYGTAGIQTFRGGVLDEPDKSYKFNDHEVVINDGNDRQVKIIDQNTNQVVWEYGQYHTISPAPGFLQGNTSVIPLESGKQFLITDTTAKKIILVDRATKNIVWQYAKTDAKWLQNVSIDWSGNFVLEDRQKGEVFAVNRDGKIVWDLTKLSDGNSISYPTDTATLDNGHILIAESGRHRIIEVIPETGELIREYLIHGLVSTIAIDKKSLDEEIYSPQTTPMVQEKPETIVVEDSGKNLSSGNTPATGNQIIEGVVADTNPSTGKAGSISLKEGFGIQVYNYSRVVNKNGIPLSLMSIKKGDKISATGTLSGTYLRATKVQDNSQ